MIAAALLVVALATAVAPSVADQFDELRPQAEEGIREASEGMRLLSAFEPAGAGCFS